MSYETIQFEMHRTVGLVTLNRPAQLNALSLTVAHEFRAAFSEAGGGGARSIVIRGGGRAFSAGGDLRDRERVAEAEGNVGVFFDEPLKLLHECVLLIRRTPLPVIAAVNGIASGGGCNLALACDLVVACESARFNQAFIKIGLTPDCGGTFILPRLVGWKRATELLFTGELISATAAVKMGMINSITPDGELMSTVMAMAEKLAQAPTAAIAQIKRLLEASTANDLRSQLELERETQ